MTPAGPGIVAARVSLVLVVALLLQMSVAARIEIFGAMGDLMLCVAIMAGLATGSDRGLGVAFAAGIAYDLLLHSPFGLSALVYVLVAYLVGSMQDTVLRAAWWIPTVTAVIGSAIGVILYAVFGTMVGEELIGPELVRIALVVSALNAVVAHPVLRVVRWATDSGGSARARAIMR